MEFFVQGNTCSLWTGIWPVNPCWPQQATRYVNCPLRFVAPGNKAWCFFDFRIRGELLAVLLRPSAHTHNALASSSLVHTGAKPDQLPGGGLLPAGEEEPWTSLDFPLKGKASCTSTGESHPDLLRPRVPVRQSCWLPVTAAHGACGSPDTAPRGPQGGRDSSTGLRERLLSSAVPWPRSASATPRASS